MEKLLGDFIAGQAKPGLYGVAIAAVLLLVARLALAQPERRKLRAPIYFLVAHGIATGVGHLFPAESGTARTAAFIALVALLFALGRLVGLLVLDVLLGRTLKRPMPAILRDIAQGVLYLALLFAALRAIGVEPGSILTTGAVVTAVIGLSLQETLGNLVAGLAIQVQRPFDVGDWIQFDPDPKRIGRVIEINWRATTVLTLDDVEVIVPNGMLAKAPIVNFTKPTKASRRSVFFVVGHDVPPKRVHELVMEAIRDGHGVLDAPPPSIVTNAFNELGVEYWVRFHTELFDKRDGVDGGVRDRIWYALHRAGISTSVPQRTVHIHQHSDETRAKDEERRADRRERALAKVGILRIVAPEVRRRLATHGATRLFSPNEIIVRQGDEADELFIVLRGTVAVMLATQDGGLSEVTRLGRGQFFGEMSLITGERRQATVRAVTECELLVIGHAAFHDVLASTPHLAEEISRVLAERQTLLDDHAASLSADERAEAVSMKSVQFLDRIKEFFAL